jgi:hypothetical protein
MKYRYPYRHDVSGTLGSCLHASPNLLAPPQKSANSFVSHTSTCFLAQPFLFQPFTPRQGEGGTTSLTTTRGDVQRPCCQYNISTIRHFCYLHVSLRLTNPHRKNRAGTPSMFVRHTRRNPSRFPLHTIE